MSKLETSLNRLSAAIEALKEPPVVYDPRYKTNPQKTYPWRIRISDGFSEWEYELPNGSGDYAIHDVYEAVRQKLNAKPAHGKYIGIPRNQ